MAVKCHIYFLDKQNYNTVTDKTQTLPEPVEIKRWITLKTKSLRRKVFRIVQL